MAIFYRRLPRFDYIRPETIDDVLAILEKNKGKAKVIAGGTDLIPQLRKREVNAPEYLIDLKAIPGLAVIVYDETYGLKIGPLATIGNTIAFMPVMKYYPSLFMAASSMASPQIRNRGTIAGNICNGVPSADTAPALLVMNARIRLKGHEGERLVDIDKFFTGPKETVLKEDEMLTEIAMPVPPRGLKGMYLKHSPRHSMDLAIAGVAVAGILEDGMLKEVRIGLGAVAPTPIRAKKSESILMGRHLDQKLIEEAANSARDECCPIDDHRASAEYRRDMVYVLTRRALMTLFTG